LEEIARASPAVATLLTVHLSVSAAPIDLWGSEEQKERWLPRMADGSFLGAFALTEPGAGSDAARLLCRYRRADGEFVLDGSKMFITNAASADVIVLFATRDPKEEQHGISAFLVAKGTPGYRVTQQLDKLGLRGSETTEIVLEGARLPASALLGPEGQGLSIALGALAGGRVGIAACALGVARAAFDEMQDAVRADPVDWKRSTLARCFTQLFAAATLVDRAAQRKDEGQAYVREASAAKLATSQAAVDIASRAIDVIGFPAVRSGHRAERLLRDARVFPIVEGTTEIQELILGRVLSDPKLEPDV
jgi:alkylation response protein AidB-like acyl-CoA dehydrogenase